jgi:hypothetical protein
MWHSLAHRVAIYYDRHIFDQAQFRQEMPCPLEMSQLIAIVPSAGQHLAFSQTAFQLGYFVTVCQRSMQLAKLWETS